MAVDSDVTPDDVRGDLNGLSSDVIDDATLSHHIDRAEVIVGEYAADDADESTVEMAVSIVAAHAALTSDSNGWQESVSELDVSVSIDVEGMVNTLAARRREALALVSPDAGAPSLRSVGDRMPGRE